MPTMKDARYRSVAVIAAVLLLPTGALTASHVPPFEVAYRAWELVTQLARRNAACWEAARSACTSSKLRAAAATAKKCEEFR